MKKIIPLLIVIFLVLTIASCVENSSKYKTLLAQYDSLAITKDSTKAELDRVFETLNEVENGLKSLREAENIFTLQTQQGKELSLSTREQMRSDISAIKEAITGYKNQIEKLKNESRIQSAQFKKRLEALTLELEEKSALITDLQRQLEEKEAELVVKTGQIATLDEAVATLQTDISTLKEEKEVQKETIATQDQLLNTAFYIVGNKNDLISARVLSKGGLFRPARISYEAEQSTFMRIDIRKTSAIRLNSKKAKVLSLHPAGTYSLDQNESGLLVLNITSPSAFWEQTKYLVIEIQ